MTTRTVGKRILVIDDHADAAGALGDYLATFGHEVHTAGTGEEGLRKIRALRPDVVFCDWRLPDISGPEIARTVRSEPAIASTTMVSLTAIDDASARRYALSAGFDVHLVKPPDLEAIMQVLAAEG